MFVSGQLLHVAVMVGLDMDSLGYFEFPLFPCLYVL